MGEEEGHRFLGRELIRDERKKKRKNTATNKQNKQMPFIFNPKVCMLFFVGRSRDHVTERIEARTAWVLKFLFCTALHCTR